MNLKTPLIVLASASPRRKEILERHGIHPIIFPSDVEETIPEEVEKEGFAAVVEFLSRIKARAIQKFLKEHPDALPPAERVILLGADTVVVKDRIIGKPRDEADAFAILSDLRNSEHHVLTGVCLIDLSSGEETVFSCDTKVIFKDYPDEEIRRFIREEPPFDKSGSYAIQSSWSKNIAEVDGDIENVMGLPFVAIAPYLK
ncbi:MAG: Maf family protein [Clostridiales Family XIII bacterium]|jgi:septum formation protein|nr:Maf family protein [Clostridiales Family XIII bacterium]